MTRFILYALALVSWVAIFWADFPVLVHFWNGEDYSHCYLIVPIIIYLVWNNRSRIAEASGGSGFFGYLLLLISILFLFIGRFGSLRYFVNLSMWASFCGMALVALGQRSFRALWLPMVIGVFAIPFPAFIDRLASFRLRLISSYLSEQVLRLLNIPVFREGNVIDLGVIQLQVVDACSGLRYLWPSILMALLVGWFFLKAPWKRIVLLLASIPVTIFSNAFRIALTGILTKFIDPVLAQGFFHDFSGWLVYVLSLGILWGITMLLASERDKNSGDDVKPVDVARFNAVLPGAWNGAVVLVLLATLWAGPFFLKQQQYTPHRNRFTGLPMQVAQWQGKYSKLSEPVLKSLGLDDYMNGQFSTPGERGDIWVLVSWYAHQTVEHAAHAPTSCLLGGGWDMLSKRVLPPVSGGRAFPVTQMVLGKGSQKLISNFWLLQRGRVVTSEWLNKWYLVQDALLQQRTDGALVRIEMAVPPGKTVEQVQETLNGFAASLRQELSVYLPEDY
jgi:exosortase D (VPLPA-CTERM-specific)